MLPHARVSWSALQVCARQHLFFQHQGAPWTTGGLWSIMSIKHSFSLATSHDQQQWMMMVRFQAFLSFLKTSGNPVQPFLTNCFGLRHARNRPQRPPPGRRPCNRSPDDPANLRTLWLRMASVCSGLAAWPSGQTGSWMDDKQ